MSHAILYVVGYTRTWPDMEQRKHTARRGIPEGQIHKCPQGFGITIVARGKSEWEIVLPLSEIYGDFRIYLFKFIIIFLIIFHFIPR